MNDVHTVLLSVAIVEELEQPNENKNRSTRHPQHTHISSNFSTTATDNNGVCTSFIILQNILHFPQNIHYQQQI